MPKIEVYNVEGKKVSDLELKEEIFGIEPNEAVVHSVLVNYLANQRQGTQNTKTRSEVRGGGRKPWRQKGTGRARQGSIRAPQWRGGGIALGPKPRNYEIKTNRKERRIAMLSALSYKAKEKNIVVVDNFDLASNKTKDFVKALTDLELIDKKVIICLEELTENVILASSNLGNVLLMEPCELNVLDIVNADVLLFSKEALKEVEEAYK